MVEVVPAACPSAFGMVLRKEGEDTPKKMLNMQVQGKRRRGEAQEKMVGQYQGEHERVQDD